MKRAAMILASVFILSIAPAALADDAPSGYRPPEGVVFQMTGGIAYHRFYDLSLFGPQATIALGGGRRNFAIYGQVTGFFGKTDAGLKAWEVVPGATVDTWSGLFHFGGGVDIGLLEIHRASYDATMSTVGLGLHAQASVDLVRTNDLSIMLGGRFVGRFYVSDDSAPPVLWGPEAFLGFRL